MDIGPPVEAPLIEIIPTRIPVPETLPVEAPRETPAPTPAVPEREPVPA